ncbi:hypothetical protein AAVH_19011 [Aphelenchoides avenae]|nr:hypothetical protein AAVH_19011 [Aphelenchus avenae]
MKYPVPASCKGKVACDNDNELAELSHLRKEIERILTKSLNKAWNEGTEKAETSGVSKEVGRTLTEMANRCWDEGTDNSETSDLTKEVVCTVKELTDKCWDEVSESEDSDTFYTSDSQSSLLSGDEADVSADSLLDDLAGRMHTAIARPFADEELSPEELELYRQTFELGWGDDGDDDSEDSSGYGAINGLEVDGEELDLYRRTFEEGWE